MRSRFCSAAILGGWLALTAAMQAQSVTQASSYAEAPIAVGEGGYVLNFSVQWSCDDAPSGTVSAPGRIDLVDAGGGTVAELSATLGGGSPVVSLSGAGAVTNVSGELDQSGAGGTPANGFVSGTWTLTGIAAGNYTLRYWGFQEANADSEAGTIWTAASDAGGSGPIAAPPPASADPDPPESAAPASAPPVPTAADPAPAAPAAPPPSLSISAPASIAAGQSFYASATATAAPGGNPLQTLILESSTDGGATWSAIGATPTAANPSDTEGNPAEFALPGTVELRARAYDTAGLEATADQVLTVVPANPALANPGAVPAPPATAAPDDGAPGSPPADASVPSPGEDPAPEPTPTVDPTPSVAPGANPPAAPPPATSPAPGASVGSSTVPASPAPAYAGAILADDAARTLRSDRHTAVHQIISGAAPRP